MSLVEKIERSKNYINTSDLNAVFREIIKGKLFVIYDKNEDYGTYLFSLLTNAQEIILFSINPTTNTILTLTPDSTQVSYTKFSDFLIANLQSFYSYNEIIFKLENDIDTDEHIEYPNAGLHYNVISILPKDDEILENTLNNSEFSKFFKRIVTKFKERIYDDFKMYDDNFETLMGTILQTCRETASIKKYYDTYKENPTDLEKLKSFFRKILELRHIYILVYYIQIQNMKNGKIMIFIYIPE